MEKIKAYNLKAYFQEIVGVHKGRRLFETLVRMDTPHGEITPEVILNKAKEEDALDEIFFSMLDQSCSLINAHTGPERTHIVISVNIDDQTLLSHGFISKFYRTLSTHNISPDNIKLELVEHKFETEHNQKDLNTIYRNLKTLSDSGINLCMDDLGQEGSNAERYFNLLRKGIAIHTVKLDRDLMPSKNENHKKNIERSGLEAIVRHANKAQITLTFVLEGAEYIDRDFYSNMLSGHFVYYQSFGEKMPQPFDRTLEDCSPSLKSQKQNDLRQYA